MSSTRRAGPGAERRRTCAGGALPLRPHHCHLVGGHYHNRLRTETAREALERSEELKRDCRLVDVHVIYTDGYAIAKGTRHIAGDMLLDRGVKSEISAVLAQLGKAMSNRNYFDNWPKLMAGQMDRRERWRPRRPSGAWRFPTMRTTTHGGNVTDFAVGRCEGTHGRPGELRHPPGLHRTPRREPRLSAHAGARRA